MPPTAASSGRQRIAVIGLGSIGGVVAGLLAAANRHEIVACVRRPIERMTVERTEGTILSPLPALTDPSQAQPQELGLALHQGAGHGLQRAMAEPTLRTEDAGRSAAKRHRPH